MGSGFAGVPQFGRFNHDTEASDSDNDVRNEADLVGKTMLRRSKIFIAIGIQNCRELRRSDIFPLNPKRSSEVQKCRSSEDACSGWDLAARLETAAILNSRTPVTPELLSRLRSVIFLLALPSSLTWRNWQTRTAQDRMGQPVEVRVLS
jgi:hypothetical protein